MKLSAHSNAVGRVVLTFVLLASVGFTQRDPMPAWIERLLPVFNSGDYDRLRAFSDDERAAAYRLGLYQEFGPLQVEQRDGDTFPMLGTTTQTRIALRLEEADGAVRLRGVRRGGPPERIESLPELDDAALAAYLHRYLDTAASAGRAAMPPR